MPLREALKACYMEQEHGRGLDAHTLSDSCCTVSARLARIRRALSRLAALRRPFLSSSVRHAVGAAVPFRGRPSLTFSRGAGGGRASSFCDVKPLNVSSISLSSVCFPVDVRTRSVSEFSPRWARTMCTRTMCYRLQAAYSEDESCSEEFRSAAPT